MKISDISLPIPIGTRIKSLISDRQGTIVSTDREDDEYSWILWDGEPFPYSGFFWNDCECEVVSLPDANPISKIQDPSSESS